ncbi:MAG: 50S ribosomal protein L21 [Alphaproteobacteria bacterium]
MHAVFRTGGKQYRVAAGDVLSVERLVGEEGSELSFSDVLFVEKPEGAQIGTPVVVGAEVKAELVAQIRGEKIIVFKKKRRQNYRRKNGHKQDLTLLRIKEIVAA